MKDENDEREGLVFAELEVLYSQNKVFYLLQRIVSDCSEHPLDKITIEKKQLLTFMGQSQYFRDKLPISFDGECVGYTDTERVC